VQLVAARLMFRRTAQTTREWLYNRSLSEQKGT